MPVADYNDLFASAGQQHGVPPQLLAAVSTVEDASGDPHAVGPTPAIGDPNDRAVGIMQIRASNAKAAGIDPTNPAQAVNWAAGNLADLYKRYGSWDKAVMAYHGGTNPSNWGPRTVAYHAKVQNALGGTVAQPKDNSGFSVPWAAADAAPQGNLDPFANLNKAPQTSNEPAVPWAASGVTPQGDLDPFANLDKGQAPQAGAAPKAATAADNGQAQDLAMGGASPDIARQLASVAASVGAGLGRGFGRTMLGAQNIVGDGLSFLPGMLGRAGQWLHNDATTGAAKLDAENAPYAAANPVANTIGDVGGQALPLMAGPGGAAMSRLGALGDAAAARMGSGYMANLAGKALGGAAQGAVAGSLDPNGNPIGNALLGAATGGVLSPAIGAALNPVLDPAVQGLKNAGVRLTTGQSMGGIPNWLEQKAGQILPVAGQFISRARANSAADLNTVVANRALNLIGEQAESPPGRELNAEITSKLSNAYDELLPQMKFVADPQFAADLANIRGMAQNMNPQYAQQFETNLRNRLFSKLAPGQPTSAVENELNLLQQSGNGAVAPANMQRLRLGMDGQSLKELQEEFGDEATDYLASGDAKDRKLGAAYAGVRDAIEGALARSNPPALVNQLQNLNTAYAIFARMRAAGGYNGAPDGVFTSDQLQRAVRSQDRSAGKGAFFRGDALLQDLSDPAKRIMSTTARDSGTPEGVALISGLPWAFAHPVGGAAAGAALSGLSAAYTRPGQAAINAMLFNRPDLVRSLAPGAQKFVAPMAGGLLGAPSSGETPAGAGLLGQ